MTFWEYDLTAETLLIGERIKKGTHRPVIPAFSVGERTYRAVPYSVAVGALREYLGLRWDVPMHAAGYLCPPGDVNSLVIAPRDNVTGVSKLPITVEFLTGVQGKLFVLVDEHTRALPPEFSLHMGGMRYKGIGLCSLKRARVIEEPEVRSGTLLTRIPEAEAGHFSIVQVEAPIYGYLFKPTSQLRGAYVRSLFEQSRTAAVHFLLEDDNASR